MFSRRSKRNQRNTRRRRSQRGGNIELTCITGKLNDQGLSLTSTDLTSIMNRNNTKYHLVKVCTNEISKLTEIKTEKTSLEHKIYEHWLCLKKTIDNDEGRDNNLVECKNMYDNIISRIEKLPRI